jgi:hypothetical protein
MILETQEEKDAFAFVCKLADERTDRICNDLDKEYLEKFKNLKAESYDPYEKKTIERPMTMDFDVIHWLKRQIRE